MAQRSWAGISLGVLIVMATVPANAQPWTGERWVRGRPHRFAGEIALYGSDPQWAVSPSFAARIRIVDESSFNRDAFIVDLDLAARAVGIAGRADSFRLGNPYAGVRFGWREPTWRFRAGVGTTAPITNLYDEGPEDLLAYYYGQALHGGYDGWLLEPQIQPLVTRADFELHAQYFQFGLDAAFTLAFPLRQAGGGNTEYAFQTGVFGAVTPIPELALGARFDVWFATNWLGLGGVDEAQLSVIPLFLRVQLPTFFVEGRLLLNLDDPYGLAFADADGIWAASLVVGGRA